MKLYLFLLGRQTALSKLELTRVLPNAKVVEENFLFVVLQTEEEISHGLLSGLGGTERVAEILGDKGSSWTAEEIADKLYPLPANKFALGISSLPLPGIRRDSPSGRGRKIKALAQELKNLVKSKGGSMKFVLPKAPAIRLNAAQVIFNRLTTGSNRELILAEGDGKWYLARTVQVQDIQAYEKRDTGKPGRDAKAGMLPPKLAQIMLNIALPPPPLLREDSPSGRGRKIILDPFCGTGTALQEGWLMGYKMIGMDADERIVKLAKKNLDWVEERFEVDKSLRPELSVGDIRRGFKGNKLQRVDAVVTEPFLGKPLKKALSPDETKSEFVELGRLYVKSFEKIKEVLREDGSVLFLMPAFKQEDGSWALVPDILLDQIGAKGYRQEQLAEDRNTLVYGRPEALVGRELTLWHTRKRRDRHN